MLNHGRRRYSFDIKHRRMLLVEIHRFPELAAEIVRHKPRNIRGAVKAHQVCHRSTGGSGLEAVSLCNNPSRHKSAVTPTHHTESRRICNAHLDDSIDTGHQILVITESPVFQVCTSKVGSVTTRAARIR